MRALVLSGGGNRGAMQAGAVEVLFEAGLTFDLFVGTSVGALNAAYLAADPTPDRASAMSEIWRAMTAQDIVADRTWHRAANVVRRRDHLYSPNALRHHVEIHLPYRRLEDAAVPVIVVATDILTGQEVRLREGPAVDAILASAAIPGIFPPVPWGDQLLIDGGSVANVPVAAAVEAGADELWVLDTGQLCGERVRPRTALDVALQSMAIMATARSQAELACAPPGAALHHVPLICRHDRWFSDLSGTAASIDDGRAMATSYLQTIPTPIRSQ